jgi:prepilin-type N-terminal cleavage/methylation domain-containing protein
MIVARNQLPRGFTLVEVLVTTGIMAIVGLMIFLVLNSGMVLYAKNTAVNSAHQQARTGVDQMVANIHAAVSIPQLIDTNLQPVATIVDGSGNPIPAAGVSYQVFSGGPFPVDLNAAATDTAIRLYCPGYLPPLNARLNIPSHNIELDAVSTSVAGSNITFNFAQPIGTAIAISGTGVEGGAGTTYIITAFITARRGYVVVGSELRYYTDLVSYKVIARNLVTTTPFSIPTLAGGSLQNRYVAAVDLSTAEPSFNQRGYAAVNMFVSSLIPFRCRLTNLQ